MKLLVLFATAPYLAYAACPNACSEQGQCKEHDSCECSTNFIGGDCSLRQCPYYKSWVTTPQGDINFDGDCNDATIFDSDHRFDATSVNFLIDQPNPGGTWESWPSFFSKSKDEGHFYMECANRGICNRKEGQCECFPGYTGVACRRTSCPEDCSGHGQCRTVGQQAPTGVTYSLWDAEMSRSCECDPGWVGPACSERACPIGDDPLTVVEQRNEVQFVDIFTDDAHDSGTDGPFAGQISFKYTDYYGAVWTTSAFDVEPVGETANTSPATMAADAEAALLGIPNDVIKSVNVTVSHCDEVLVGDKDGTAGTGTILSASGFFRCPQASTATSVYFDDASAVFLDAAGIIPISSLSSYGTYPGLTAADGTGAVATIDVDDNGDGDDTCNRITHAHCTRFRIEFLSTPGDLVELDVDLSAVTVVNQDTGNAETTVQGATTVSKRVTDRVPISADKSSSETTGIIIPPMTGEIECAAEDCNIADVDGKTVITTSGDTLVDAAANFGTNERIRIECGSKKLGTYTISATTFVTATEIVLQEKAPACDGLAGNQVKLYSDTNYVIVSLDLRPWDDGADHSVPLRVGDYIGYQGSDDSWYGPFGPILAKPGDPTEPAIYWEPTNSLLDATSSNGRVFFGNAVDLAGSQTGGHFVNWGKGSTEKSECSDRGVCDSDSGLCNCFAGYTGHACETQNALRA